MEAVDGFGVLAGDVSPTDQLPNHRAVLGFHQAVVVGMPRPRLGLLDQQFVEQPGHGVIDELAAVVGMKAVQAKRELFQHRLQHGDEKGLGDLRGGADHLPLRDFVDGIDMIQPLAALLVALVYRVHAQIPGLASRIGPAALADGHRRGPGGLIGVVPLPIFGRFAKPVDLRHRNARQPLEDGLAILGVLPLQNAAGTVLGALLLCRDSSLSAA